MVTQRILPPNREAVSFPADEINGSIIRRFEKIAAQRPEAIAVKFETQVWTFETLNCRANRIARAVIERRGTHSEPIALLFGPGVNPIAAILGVQKAGKFFFAIDPQFPVERSAILVHRYSSAANRDGRPPPWIGGYVQTRQSGDT